MTHTSTDQCTACYGSGTGENGFDCLRCAGDGWVFAEPARPAVAHTSTEQPEALREYDVCVIFDASRNVTVLARTPEEAAELAEDEVHGAQHLCCQCSGQLDTGDAIGSHVYEGDTEVLDSTAAGELRIELAAAKARIAELEASKARVPIECVVPPQINQTLNRRMYATGWADCLRAHGITQEKQG